MRKWARFLFLQYMPFLASLPVLVILGPFRYRYRETIRKVIARVWGFDPYSVGLPEALVPTLRDPSTFTSGKCGVVAVHEDEDGSLDSYETHILGGIVRCLRPAARIFEIGSFRGRTARNLAANALGSQAVFSLDIEDRLDKSLIADKYAEVSRITFLRGDSTRFEPETFTAENGRPDLVLIDGSHERSVVVSDSKLAWNLTGDGAIIAWHDYAQIASVRNAVHDFLQSVGRLNDARWIEATSLVLLRR